MSDAPIPLDPARMLRALNDRDVCYVIVGSSAAAFHGAARDPHDLDIVTPNDARNFEQLAAALTDLNAKPWIPDLTPADLPFLRSFTLDGPTVGEFPISLWITDAGRLDLLDAIVGIDPQASTMGRVATRSISFEELDATAISDFRFGSGIRVASLAHVRESATAVDRPQDRATLIDLARIHDRPQRRFMPPPEPRPGIDVPHPEIDRPEPGTGYER